MLRAIEISECEKKALHTRPVFVQDIMQPTLHELTAPCDVLMHGRGTLKTPLRLPTGTVIASGYGHFNGPASETGWTYALMCDLWFRGGNGQEYRAERGMKLTVLDR